MDNLKKRYTQGSATLATESISMNPHKHTKD